MTTFRKIVPDSEVRAINERYEHKLVWLSKNGGVRSWFFSHSNGSEIEDVDNFSLESLSDIRNVPTSDRFRFRCTTQFMDSNTFDYVRSIFASNRVYKITKSGDQIPVAVMKAKPVRPNRVKNFTISMEFEYQEEDILNV